MSAGPRQPIALRSAIHVASSPTRADWLLRPYVERSAMILMVGAEGTFKSFLALHWALTIATEKKQLVVYLSAEGRGLWKRLRAWAIHHYPRQSWAETLNGLPFLALEQALNLSDEQRVEDLIASIQLVSEAHGRPVLIVVDTLTRNSDGTVERSNEDALGYLNRLDQLVRCRFGCSIILVHHIGHAARDRARGPFSLIASTDANFLLERPDNTSPLVTVRSGRMKDCETPAPFALEAHAVTLDALDEDDRPVTSMVLKCNADVPVSRPAPTGKCQRRLLAELERRAAQPDCMRIWTELELRKIGRDMGMVKASARDAVHGLRGLGYFADTVGGSYLTHIPPEGVKGVKRGETSFSPAGAGGEKGESPLGLTLSPTPLTPESTPAVGGGHDG